MLLIFFFAQYLIEKIQLLFIERLFGYRGALGTGFASTQIGGTGELIEAVDGQQIEGQQQRQPRDCLRHNRKLIAEKQSQEHGNIANQLVQNQRQSQHQQPVVA